MKSQETSPSRLPLRQHPPKQARSRLTLHRLLSAAEALLEHGGLEAATVPAIARAAGVSVGVVYRRFPDKDDLLRAVYERFFTTTREQNWTRLQAAPGQLPSLPDLSRAVIRGMAEGYRRKRGLLRALKRYAQTHPDAAFRRAAHRLNREAMSGVARLLLLRRDEVRHPEPETAIEVGLLAVASVLQSVILEHESVEWVHLPHDLEQEMLRMFLSYLGVKSKA